MHQFSECIEAVVWAVGKQEADLGEDLIVHIYFEFVACSTLFVQFVI